MTAESAAVTAALMTQEVDSHHSGQPALDTTPDESSKQKPGSSRRGKQYKCGNCHELGHNQKTCPRRASTGNEATAIQPALGVEAAEIFASNVAPALPGGIGNGHTHVAVTRVQPCKLDAALEAANKRVIAADKQVANATTDQDFEDATAALDSAVRHLEKVASCAQRCAMVAHTLSGGTWETPERETKRMRMDAPSTPNALTPTPIALNDATATTTGEVVENADVVSTEAKEEAPLE